MQVENLHGVTYHQQKKPFLAKTSREESKMLIAIGWLVCGVFTAVIAAAKGRSFLGWLALGCIFGIFALLAVGFMPARA